MGAQKPKDDQIVPTQTQEPKAPTDDTQDTPQDAPEPTSVASEEAISRREQEIEAREQALAAREKAAEDAVNSANALIARVDERMGEIDKKLAEVNRDVNKDAMQRTSQEKSDLVTKLQDLAYADASYTNESGETIVVLSDIIEYTPLVTLANNTNAGMIVYEKGIKYLVPQCIVDDLRVRESTHLDYKENLHIRNDNVLNSGTISGGGK